MNKRTFLLFAVLGTVLIACIVYIALPLSLKLAYVLDEAHLATIRPEGNFANMTCPYDGSTLTQIVILQEEGADAPWRGAYVCEVEGIFWICDYQGGIGKIHWYGPFEATWGEANLLAAIGVALSATAFIVFLAKHYHNSKQLNIKSETCHCSQAKVCPHKLTRDIRLRDVSTVKGADLFLQAPVRVNAMLSQLSHRLCYRSFRFPIVR